MGCIEGKNMAYKTVLILDSFQNVVCKAML